MFSSKDKKGSLKTPSIISVDIKIKGEVISSGEIQIDGVMEGNIKSKIIIL